MMQPRIDGNLDKNLFSKKEYLHTTMLGFYDEFKVHRLKVLKEKELQHIERAIARNHMT